MHRPPRIFAAIVLLVAIAFLYGGVRLLAVGGSLYYVVAGVALLASGIFLWRGDKRGSRVYGALLVVTLLWSLFEVGTDLWALLPRLAFLGVLGAWLLTPFARRGLYSQQPAPALLGTARSRSIAAASALAVIAIFIVGSRNTADELPARIAAKAAAASEAKAGEWHHYGNTTHGTRYARLDQLNASNVGSLTEIWHYRSATCCTCARR
jgi:quinoprotein glucose dehydrogenase